MRKCGCDAFAVAQHCSDSCLSDRSRSLEGKGSLPFCYTRLVAEKPGKSPLPSATDSLGKHILYIRKQRNLEQRDVAKTLGVDPSSVLNWEKEHSQPVVKYWPSIMGFLGYCPAVPKTTQGQKIRALREVLLGMSRKALGKVIGVDPCTLSIIEQDQESQWASVRTKYADVVWRFRVYASRWGTKNCFEDYR